MQICLDSGFQNRAETYTTYNALRIHDIVSFSGGVVVVAYTANKACIILHKFHFILFRKESLHMRVRQEYRSMP